MAGEAKTQSFSIGTATVMLGPIADMFKLTPADHGIGLVKDFTVSAEPTYTDLRQGVKNSLVYSVLTQNEVRASCSVYEYTAQNLRYSLGLESAGATLSGEYVLAADTVAAATGATVLVGGLADTAAAVAKGFAKGAWIYVHENTGNQDQVHIGQLSADVTGSFSGTGVTQAFAIVLTAATPFPRVFPKGSRIGTIDKADAGVKTEQSFHSMKVVGLLPEGAKPIVLLVPKVRIVRGFSLGFSTDDFQAMPFEFGFFELTGTEGSPAVLPDGGVLSVLSS